MGYGQKNRSPRLTLRWQWNVKDGVGRRNRFHTKHSDDFCQRLVRLNPRRGSSRPLVKGMDSLHCSAAGQDTSLRFHRRAPSTLRTESHQVLVLVSQHTQHLLGPQLRMDRTDHPWNLSHCSGTTSINDNKNRNRVGHCFGLESKNSSGFRQKKRRKKRKKKRIQCWSRMEADPCFRRDSAEGHDGGLLAQHGQGPAWGVWTLLLGVHKWARARREDKGNFHSFGGLSWHLVYVLFFCFFSDRWMGLQVETTASLCNIFCSCCLHARRNTRTITPTHSYTELLFVTFPKTHLKHLWPFT